MGLGGDGFLGISRVADFLGMLRVGEDFLGIVVNRDDVSDDLKVPA